MKSRLTVIALLLLTSAFAFAGDDIKELRSKSKKQGWLGVGIQDVTPKFARENDLKIKEGAYINEIVDDSPADSSELKEGDIVVEFNGKKIEASDDLTDAVRETKPGTRVNVKINRKGENKTIAVNIGKNRMRMPMAVVAPHAPKGGFHMFGRDIEGMELMEMNRQLAEYFEAPNGKGVLVKEVENDENAAKAGIKAGDVIIKVGEEAIKDVEDIRDAISELKEGDKVNIEVLRKGKRATISLEISEEEYGDNIFWREHAPGDFNFHIEPQIDNIQREIEMKMRKLPRIQKEIQRIKMRTKTSEV